MGTLYLVRHGQASYGGADYDRLSELGVRQAQQTGRSAGGGLLRGLDAIYTGPLKRQRDTADHLRAAAAEAGHEVPELAVIDELAEYPAFELLAAWLPRLAAEQPRFAALAGGLGTPEAVRLLDHAFEDISGKWVRGELDTGDVETFEGFATRVRRGIERVVAAHGKGRVAAVTSGGVIGVALQLALGFDGLRTTKVWRNIRNASITEFLWRSDGFAWRDGDFSVVGFNHVQHLGEPDLLTFR
jgi:broad specificity phosphatase PhoE